MKKIKNTDDVFQKKERVFTDREEHRAAFWKKYNQAKNAMAAGEEISIISYYGIGGIGKSRLFEKLRAEMDENETVKTPYYADIDFYNCHDSRDAVEKLANKLSNRYKFDFTLFDLCNYAYSQKIGENPDMPHTKGIIENSPFLSGAVELIGGVPIPEIGIGAQVLSVVDRLVAGTRDILNSHKKEIYSLKDISVEEHNKILIKYFVKDIRRNMEKKKISEPIVIFLDTYESLVNELAQVGDPLQNDLWLRGDDGIICMIPGVLWVIGGREKLKWADLDPDWADVLEQYNLGGLSEEDSYAFLEAEGIAEADLRKTIFHITDGTPVYLNLCVDHYESLVSRNITPESGMFGKNTRDLVGLFIKYMDKQQQDMVYTLACMGKWTDEIAVDKCPLLIPGFSLSAYETIKNLSFVNRLDSGEYVFHQVMGEVLLSHAPETIKQSIGEKLVEVYKETLENHDFFAGDYGDALFYTVRGGVVLCSDKESFEKFYKEKIEKNLQNFAEAGMAENACEISEMMLSEYRAETDSSLYLSLMEGKAYIFGILGRHDETLALRKEVVRKSEILLGKDHHDTLMSMNNLAMIFDDMGKRNEALVIQKEVFEKLELKLGTEHPDTLLAMSNMASILAEMGRHSEAYGLQEKVFEKSKTVLGEDNKDTLIAAGNLAITLGKLDNHEEALKLQKEVLEKRIALLGENHLDTLTAMNNLASILAGMGRRDEAFEIEKVAFEKRSAVLGEDHPDTLTSMSNLASTICGMGKPDEAFEMQKTVIEKRKVILGEDHPDTLTAMNNQASALGKMNKPDEAAKLQKEVLEKRIAVLGENHHNTLMAMNNLASTLGMLKNHDEAVRLQQETFEKSKTALGENHSDTLLLMRNLAYILMEAKKYIEALKLLRELVVKQKAVLGENHKYTVESLKHIEWIETKFKLRPVHHHSHTKKKKKRK